MLKIVVVLSLSQPYLLSIHVLKLLLERAPGVHSEEIHNSRELGEYISDFTLVQWVALVHTEHGHLQVTVALLAANRLKMQVLLLFFATHFIIYNCCLQAFLI